MKNKGDHLYIISHSVMRVGELCNYNISSDVTEDVLMLYPKFAMYHMTTYQIKQCLSTPMLYAGVVDE